MAKVGFVGEEDFVLPFKGIGAEVFPVSTGKEALQCLEKIKEEKYAIVYLSETFAEGLIDEVKELNEKPGINIVILPGLQPSKDLGKENLRRLVRRAVGRDILEGG